MTFVRTSELIEASWSEFDLDSSRWDIPAERMKRVGYRTLSEFKPGGAGLKPRRRGRQVPLT